MKLMYVFCIVLLDACSNFHIATSRPTDSTFLEIAQDPKNYEGKMVTMRGWISLRDEDKNLWATWGDHENWRTPKCVSLINYDWLDGLERKIDGMYVEVSGIIRADASKSRTIIRLASCRDLGIQIAGKSSVKIIP